MKKNKISPIVIRDAVHGDIPFLEDIFIEIINTPEMQRLRQINQLSGGHLVFISATHNRFSHSIGTYYVTCQILNNHFFKKTYVTKFEKQKIKLAALLHDVGHGPFSHSFELVYKNLKLNLTHEFFSRLLIQDRKSNVYKILKKYKFTEQDIEDICCMIEGRNQKEYPLGQLISSQLDADRIDYLLRDNFFSGTGYGYIDLQFIIRNLRLSNKTKQLFFKKRCLYAIENYLVGRYHMYKQIYLHATVLGYEILFNQWFKRMKYLIDNNFSFQAQAIMNDIKFMFQPKPFLYHDFIKLNDNMLQYVFTKMMKEKDFVLQQLSNGLVNRHFFRKSKRHPKKKIEQQIKDAQKKYPNDYKWFFVKMKNKPTFLYELKKAPIYLENNQKNKSGSPLIKFDEISNLFNHDYYKSYNIWDDSQETYWYFDINI